MNCPKPYLSATAAPPPFAARDPRVQNPCPNQRRTTSPVTRLCDGRSMGHLLGYARVSTTDQQPQLQVDALERAGCYRVFTETASGARADRPTLSSSWTSCAPATPWSSGNWTGWADRCGTWSIPSPAWPSAGSGSAASRRRSTPPPRRQARLPRLRRPGRVRTRPHPRTHQRRPGCRQGPRPPRRSPIRDDRPQAAGGPGGACIASGQYSVAAIATPLGVSRASIYRHLDTTS
jgi:hypothetical protein